MELGQHSVTHHKVTRILNYSLLFLEGGEMLWMVKWDVTTRLLSYRLLFLEGREVLWLVKCYVTQRRDNRQLLCGTKPCTVVRVESKATNPRKKSGPPGSLTVLAYNREDHLSAGSKETNDFPESMKNGVQL